MKTIATSDEGVCRNSASYQTITSVSIRNKEEFDFVKMLYRSICKLLTIFDLKTQSFVIHIEPSVFHFLSTFKAAVKFANI